MIKQNIMTVAPSASQSSDVPAMDLQEQKSFLEEVGYDVLESDVEPGGWFWSTAEEASEGCQASATEAFEAAWAHAAARARKAYGMDLDVWNVLERSSQKHLMRSTSTVNHLMPGRLSVTEVDGLMPTEEQWSFIRQDPLLHRLMGQFEVPSNLRIRPARPEDLYGNGFAELDHDTQMLWVRAVRQVASFADSHEALRVAEQAYLKFNGVLPMSLLEPQALAA